MYNDTKWVLTILDEKYGNSYLYKTVNEHCKNLRIYGQTQLLKLLNIYDVIFNMIIGTWKNILYTLN